MTDRRDEIDPLEAELAAMRPAEPSPELDAAVRRRLAEQAWWRPAVPWIGPLAAAAVCAAVVTIALRNRTPDLLPPVSARVAVAPSTGPAAGADRDRPALANYRGAADLSASDLDDLLNRHAARSLAGGTAVRAAARAGSMSGIGMP